MNSFYQQPIILQWVEAILLLSIGFYPALLILDLAYDQPFYYLLFLIYLPILQFTTTPFFKLIGIYTYYAPMLLGYLANPTQIDLHSGTSFDYFFVMRKFKSGLEFRNRLLAFHLEGLLHIIQQIEKGEIPPTVTISGTSYFFNESTLKKLGFEPKEPSLFYRINLLANFIDLVWMYSVSQGKLSVPKIWKAQKAVITGAKLLANKAVIKALALRLYPSSTSAAGRSIKPLL